MVIVNEHHLRQQRRRSVRQDWQKKPMMAGTSSGWSSLASTSRSRWPTVNRRALATSGMRGIIDRERRFRAECDLRHLIWIPDAISRAFWSGRPVVAFDRRPGVGGIVVEHSCPTLGPPAASRFLRRPSARVPASAAGPAQAGVLLRSGAECQAAIGW